VTIWVKVVVEVKAEEKAAVTGRVEPAVHQAGAEETTRHQRSRIDKGTRFLMCRSAQ